MKQIFLVIFFALFFFVVHTNALAASITITSQQPQINPLDEYSVNVHVAINALNGKIYYLRGIFHLPGSANYCGFTWNGSNWYSSPIGNGNNFLPITINNNSWDGILKAKIDTTDSGCSTSGVYNFKILRYTGSSSAANDETTTEQQVMITIPTSVPSQTPTVTQMPSPTTSSIVTAKPTVTSTPKTSSTTKYLSSTQSPTPTAYVVLLTLTITPFITSVKQDVATEAVDILGASFSAKVSPTSNIRQSLRVKSASETKLSLFLLLGGMFLLGGCGIFGFQMFKNMKNKKSEDFSNM